MILKMKIYDTVIVGSGYASLGYAMTHPRCLIVEERESCDNSFSLTLRSFKKEEYTPTTEAGRRLEEKLVHLGLLSDGMMNASGLECALCEQILDAKVEVLIRTRIISTERVGELYRLRIINGGGITSVLTRRILDTCAVLDRFSLTALFTSKNPERDIPTLLASFPGATCERAFYRDRYALHVPSELDGDPHALCAQVYRTWCAADHGACLIYVAPVLSAEAQEMGNPLCDACYTDPVAAIDAGAKYAEHGGAI